MAEVVQDPEGAVLAVRRAQIAQWHAESRAEQFELILSAFDALRRGDWAPSEYSPQWRSRAEAAEAKLAALSTPPADDDLTDDEYDAKYGLPGPLDDRYPGRPTPPADDVREALTLIARDVHLHDGGENAAITGPHAQRIADAIRERFEVRPHGTVTDTEVERVALMLWADYDAEHAGSTVDQFFGQARRLLEAAREVHP
ncbi:hypothetical protein [uncultured Microbacterium sp.]|uniref:hypothetical protein n=1 Tax=uncultured Microbacterium sp. TaxID=191216 RepID=UPI0025D7C032|nr:hypothetical protein [uncultured Microbacterium sp.]